MPLIVESSDFTHENGSNVLRPHFNDERRPKTLKCTFEHAHIKALSQPTSPYSRVAGFEKLRFLNVLRSHYFG